MSISHLSIPSFVRLTVCLYQILVNCYSRHIYVYICRYIGCELSRPTLKSSESILWLLSIVWYIVLYCGTSVLDSTRLSVCLSVCLPTFVDHNMLNISVVFPVWKSYFTLYFVNSGPVNRCVRQSSVVFSLRPVLEWGGLNSFFSYVGFHVCPFEEFV
jgi:hypothetical protein